MKYKYCKIHRYLVLSLLGVGCALLLSSCASRTKDYVDQPIDGVEMAANSEKDGKIDESADQTLDQVMIWDTSGIVDMENTHTVETDSQERDQKRVESETSSSSTEAEEMSKSEAEIETTSEKELRAVEEEAVEAETDAKSKGLIVLDAGHSANPSVGTEPLGPNSSEMKAKDTSGTSGVASGLAEYELNMQVTLQLKDELERRGYQVILTREDNNIAISNIERAQVANEVGADAYIRIHANGANDSSADGAMTICQTATNPYAAAGYPDSRRLSDCILDYLVQETGAYNRGVWETDTMTGINWSQVPVTIVEMGFMTNPQEDLKMASPEYQQQIIQGIANGVDVFIDR